MGPKANLNVTVVMSCGQGWEKKKRKPAVGEGREWSLG